MGRTDRMNSVIDMMLKFPLRSADLRVVTLVILVCSYNSCAFEAAQMIPKVVAVMKNNCYRYDHIKTTSRTRIK